MWDINTNARIKGASVWLQRPDGTGDWENVPTGQTPPIMQPDENPLITGVDGQYQWDVLGGSYRVHVEASGYYPMDSVVVSIPPPVTDLHVGLTNDKLFYPDFTDTTNPNSWRSWLVLQNPSEFPANINLEIRSRAGDTLYSGAQTIPADGVSAIRPRTLVGADCAGSVVVTSNQPIMGTCQITRNSNEMCMSYNALDQGSTALYYPDFTDTTNPESWRSWLVLQNLADFSANIDLEIRSRAGDLLYSGSQVIPAHGVNAIRPRNLVGSDCAGSVVVTSDQSIVGSCQITRNSNKMCMSYSA